MGNSLIFIGPINLGKVPTSGDAVKNQLFLDRFVQVFDDIHVVDTIRWKKNPLVIIKLIWTILAHKESKIAISANPGSADKLIRIIHLLHVRNDVFYWVVGGSFHTMIKDGRFAASNYMGLKGIFVQGQSMVDSLRESGLDNALYIPNSKIIDHYGVKMTKRDDKVHFVFISRIEEYKGCTDIIKSVDALNLIGYSGKFDVTFFGRESEDATYSLLFREMVAAHKEVSYKRLLNLRDTSNYDVLARYDVMLFPTYWQGEGFPGVVIDAYISSLPIIASDWHLNADVIEEGVTGWLIPVHDVPALTDKMKYVIDHPEVIERLSQNCRNRVAQYDSRIVLSEENLEKIGLLDYA